GLTLQRRVVAAMMANFVEHGTSEQILGCDFPSLVVKLVFRPGPPIASLRIPNEQQDLAARRQFEREDQARIVGGIVHCEGQGACIGRVVSSQAKPSGIW